MRKLLIVVCLLCLSASVAMAQGKIDSQWNCGKATVEHSIEVGDQPNHSYVINQTKCTASKSEIGGVKEKDGTGTEFHEGTGSANQWHGVFVVTMANGDKLHYSYKGKGTMKGAQFQSGTNTWSIVGGTGKLKGAKGEGTCQGKGNPDGTSAWTCAGTYTLAK